MLVQGKEDFCEVIHEAAGSLATDALPQSKQYAEPTLSLSLLPPMLLGSLPWLRRDAAQKQSPVLPGEPVVRVSHLQHCLQQCFAILMHDLSHRGDLSTTRQQLRLQHRGQARSVPAQAPHCSTHVQPQPQSCLPSSPRGLHNAIILTKKPQDALTVGASGNLSERTPASKNHSG